MVRHGLFGLVGAGLVLLTSLADNLPAADADSAFKNTLIVQGAIEQARYCLLEKGDAKKAIEILEQNLARINGNAVYLRLLRDAYRSYVKDLWLAREDALARKYLERLAILDGDAARDARLAGTKTAAMAPVVHEGAAEARPLPGAKAATVRAKVDDDPFDPSYRRPSKNSDPKRAEQLVAQAEAEFAKKSYDQARVLYEQAHQANQAATASCRPRWAYCKLNHVVEQLNQLKIDGAALPDLQREVRLAMEMAPGLAPTGQWLLREIDQRRQTVPNRAAAAEQLPVTVQHRQVKGWQVAETAHFRIFHNQTRSVAEKVARIAESTRQDMARKWFGADAGDWNPKCDLYLHATAQDYSRATGVPPDSPGHSRIETENNGRVIGRRMDLHCDIATMFEAVLPHETTHVVLAGQFGRHAVPRWADEGMAVLTEPADKIEQHRKNLVQSQRADSLFSVRDLMQMQDYPQPRYIGAFYAQSVVLVDFLVRQRGPRAFADFLRDGLQGGYEQALRTHYGYRDFNDFQTRWNQHVLAESNRLTPGLAGR